MHQLSEASGRVPWPGGFSFSAAVHALRRGSVPAHSAHGAARRPAPVPVPRAVLRSLLLLPYGPQCALAKPKKLKKSKLKDGLRWFTSGLYLVYDPQDALIRDALGCIHLKEAAEESYQNLLTIRCRKSQTCCTSLSPAPLSLQHRFSQNL